MWSDLFWLVDVECNKMACSFFHSKHFFRLEDDGDVNMPQTGLCEVREKDLVLLKLLPKRILALLSSFGKVPLEFCLMCGC